MSKTTEIETIFSRRESKVRSYCRTFDAIFTTAQGSELWDTKGQRFIDFLAGCSALNYGHNDPDMKAALIEHISGNGITHGLDLHTQAKADFITAFENCILKSRNLDHKVMFTGPTGSNAVEAALKIARKVTGRSNVIAFTNGFHGMTLGALAATGNSYHRAGAGATLSGISRLPFDGYVNGAASLELLERLLQDPSSGLDAPAAILLETVQGEGGLNVASDHWLRGVAELARTHGALLVIDDVQAGCGRTGPFFSFEEMGVSPDIVTLAKSISGFGLPMGLVLVRPKHDILGPAEHNGTFRGNTHAFVTARIAIEKFWSNDSFQHDINRRSQIVTTGLKRIAETIPGARLKGKGMMLGLDVGSGNIASAICRRAFKDGLIIETSGAHDEVVKVLAPLTTPDTQIHEGLQILLNAAQEIAPAAHVAAE
ncbi:diaminobutyrate--2-oxoglutarate transaminase [Pseudovibrio exalbescens]|uniref:Diaminobutyrate--2-oxoglutarate transaminase n=1 Tax=Pseudovibrio exalbescens TaxID=197461 RepID=A0A1U7JKA0_9HYPH|nr:diaminobutyrate--2-oxoglutarate transaminase [Pseudovibrio exalbescens]OKL45149.1 diaminobutyrate--2-oxoglutarate transaminase [Pseudovibrio exalbescens]